MGRFDYSKNASSLQRKTEYFVCWNLYFQWGSYSRWRFYKNILVGLRILSSSPLNVSLNVTDKEPS
jgi:hypothetical protein